MVPLSRLRDQPYLLLSLTSLFWAGNAIIGRAVADRIPPIALAQIRWSIAFLILLPFAWSSLRKDLPAIRRHFGIMLVLSLTGIAAFNTLQYWSLAHTTAINATLMLSSAPLLIGFLSWVVFRDPLTRGQLAGVLVSLTGVAAIVSGGDPTRFASLSLNLGDIVMLVAIAIYSLYSILLRRRPAMAPLSFLTATVGIGAAVLLPLSMLEFASGRRLAPLDFESVAALAYVSIFPSILAYLFFNRGVELIGANRAGPFFHFIPLFGVVLAVIFLGERPSLHHFIGAALILGGVAVAGRGKAGGNRNRVADASQRP
jgi:drug/metabolite transporter (DMT)-like permease